MNKIIFDAIVSARKGGALINRMADSHFGGIMLIKILSVPSFVHDFLWDNFANDWGINYLGIWVLIGACKLSGSIL